MSRRERNGEALIALALLLMFAVSGGDALTPARLFVLALAALLGWHGLRLTDTD